MLWFLSGCLALRPSAPVELYDPDGYCEQYITCAELVSDALALAVKSTYAPKGSCWRGEFPKTCRDDCLEAMLVVAGREQRIECVPQGVAVDDPDVFLEGYFQAWCPIYDSCTQALPDQPSCEDQASTLFDESCEYDPAHAWLCLEGLQSAQCLSRGEPRPPVGCSQVFVCGPGR